VQRMSRQAADVQRLVDTALKTFGRWISGEQRRERRAQYNKPLVDMPEELWDFMLGKPPEAALSVHSVRARHGKQGWADHQQSSITDGWRAPSLGHYGGQGRGGRPHHDAAQSWDRRDHGERHAPGFIGTDTLRGSCPPRPWKAQATDSPGPDRGAARGRPGVAFPRLEALVSERVVLDITETVEFFSSRLLKKAIWAWPACARCGVQEVRLTTTLGTPPFAGRLGIFFFFPLSPSFFLCVFFFFFVGFFFFFF